MSNAIRAMFVFGFVMIVFVIMQSCQDIKSPIEQYSVASLKKLTVLESPPAQPQGDYQDASGGRMTLADYKGKIILVNAWATWCAPCIAEMPSLDRLEGLRGGKDFAVLPISLDRRTDDVPRFFEKTDIGLLPQWHDSSFGLSGALQLPGLPTSVFYDRDGREIARVPGEVVWDSPEALAFIDYLIGIDY